MRRSQCQLLAMAAALMVGIVGCATTQDRVATPPSSVATAPPSATEPSTEASTPVAQIPVIKVEAAPPPPTQPSVIFAGPPVAATVSPSVLQTVSNNNVIEPLPSAYPREVSEPPAPPNPLDPPEVVSSSGAISSSSSEVRDITMANILASVAGRNPQVAFASQRYAEAYARLIAARVLWLPSINSGVGWNNHAGPIQNTNGLVQNINRSSLTAGLGVQTIGAGSPVVPGLFANFHAADAVFQPRIANRAAAARDAAVQTTINDLLLDTALAYLNLLRAHQLHAITLDIQYHAEELAKTTADFARAGAGTEADADRAATELAIRQNEVVRAEEEMQVASAQLVQLLNENPRYVLRPMEHAIAPVELVPLDTPIDALLPTGLTKRPELAEAQHLVGEAVHRYRSEKMSPWMPNVLMGTSYAGFGGGTGSRIDNTAGRFDLDAIAYWQVRGMGVGEYAARREARARYDQTRFEQVRLINLVGREIVEAHAQVQARHRQIAISQRAVERATASFGRNLSRIRELKGLPIETLQSIQALDQARREYLRALVDYNTAQFRLQRALGWPIQLQEVPVPSNG